MSVVRTILFFSCAAFILLAPAYRQLFDGAVKVPSWTMFSTTGLDVYKVKFETDAEGGGRRVLDRFDVLGYENPVAAPLKVRLITDPSEARTLAKRLCKALGGNQPVYMRLEDARRDGWRVINDGSTNACKPDSNKRFER
jgi:hypothetical protein